MKISFIVFLISLIPLCESSGFLTLKLTSDQDCLVHLEVPSTEHFETVRLLAYEMRSLEISVPGVTDRLSVDIQILHHFSGDPLSEVSTEEFKLNNNGVWESRVIDSGKAILSVRSIFQCENGFFGPICERRSRNIPTSTTPTTPRTVKSPSPTRAPTKGFQITFDIIICYPLAALIILLILANIILCIHRPKKSKYIADSFPEEFQIVEISTSQEDNTYESLDAPIRFLSSTAFESKV